MKHSPKIKYALSLCLVLSYLTIFSTQNKIDSLSIDQLLKIAEKYKKQDNLEKALLYYQEIIKRDPENYYAHSQIATIHNINGSCTINVIPSINQLLTIADQYKKDYNPEQALLYYEKAIEHDPKNDYILSQASLMARLLNKYEQAIFYQEKAQAINIDHTQLLKELYLIADMPEKAFRNIKKVDSVQEKIIFLDNSWNGFGDDFMLIRYAQIFKNLGATVHVKVRPALIPLFSLCDYIDKMHNNIPEQPPHYLYLRYMDIPGFFYTNIDKNIPANVPYLKADPKLVQYWHEQLKDDTNFKIGLCWHNSIGCWLNDHLHTQRAIPLKAFAPLSKLPGISIYSLQQVTGLDELNHLSAGFTLHTFDNNFDKVHGAFMDTAAVMENLDLIITADTSIEHLAGALGRPTWTLIPICADWRWSISRPHDSAWYPTMRLFRQQNPGDWDGVIATVIQELIKIISQRSK